VGAGAGDHRAAQSGQRARLDQPHRLGGHAQPPGELAQRLGGVSVETVAARDHQARALRQPVEGAAHAIGGVTPPQVVVRTFGLGRRKQVHGRQVAVLRYGCGERQHEAIGTLEVLDLPAVQAGAPPHLLGCGQAAGLGGEGALRVAHAAHSAASIARHMHEAAMPGEGTQDGAPDPVDGVGHEPGAVRGVEETRRLHQPEVSLADQVLEGQAEVAVARGDADDEAQVRGREGAARLFRPGAAARARHQRRFFAGAGARRRADVTQVGVDGRAAAHARLPVPVSMLVVMWGSGPQKPAQDHGFSVTVAEHLARRARRRSRLFANRSQSRHTTPVHSGGVREP